MNLRFNHGFAALTFVLVTAVISLILGLTISQVTTNETILALKSIASDQSYYMANLCAEEALMNLKDDTSYSGNEEINIGNGSCTILPIEGNWTIKTIGTYQNQIKKVKIVATNINPKIAIDSWEEVADF